MLLSCYNGIFDWSSIGTKFVENTCRWRWAVCGRCRRGCSSPAWRSGHWQGACSGLAYRNSPSKSLSLLTRGDYRGWFHNPDTIAIVEQQSQYYVYYHYRDTIAIVWMRLPLSLALSNERACVVYVQSSSQSYHYTSMRRCTLYTL